MRPGRDDNHGLAVARPATAETHEWTPTCTQPLPESGRLFSKAEAAFGVLDRRLNSRSDVAAHCSV
jgi:hypothetical protein